MHEFGHAIGVKHSDKGETIMTKSVPAVFNPNRRLYEDDILAVRSLYGRLYFIVVILTYFLKLLLKI